MQKKAKILSLLIFLFLFVNIFANQDYYKSCKGLKGKKLKTALYNLIKNHKVYPYFSDTLGVAEIIKDVDADPKNSNNIILIYSLRSQPKNMLDIGRDKDYSHLGITLDDTWNREHLWSKSHGFRHRDKDIAYSDVHNLKPADRTINSAKAAKDFDWGGFAEKEAIGCYSDDDSWEPKNEVKGDIARSLMYMAVRYEGIDTSYDLELVEKTGTYGTKYGRLSTLLEWNLLDPPSEFEKNRNNIIYTRYQKNRNPFIDHPEYAELIWGKPSKKPILRLSSNMLSFGNCHSLKTIKLAICATNLTGNLIITAPKGFKISNNNRLVNSIVIKPQKLARKTLSIVFSAKQNNIYTGDITLKSPKINKTVKLIARKTNSKNSIISFDDFEQGIANWKSYKIKGEYGWIHGEFNKNKFIKIKANYKDKQAESWIIKKIDTKNKKNIFLSFDSAKNKPATDFIQVLYCNNYDDSKKVKNQNWKIIKDVNFSKGGWKWEFSGFIPIKVTSKSTVIAFKYVSKNPKKSSSWEIDNITIAN